ncbi:MAG TPA: peptidoglycan-binding domain-containing protein, partial [Candidatus Paceibacterota bacterium]
TNSAVSNVSVLIPAGTKIAVDGGVWNGILSLPTATTTYAAPTPSAGMTATVLSAITIGLGNTPVALSAPAKLTFPGQAGKLAGWSQNGVYHTITNTCDSTNTPTVATSSDCAINSGNDLLVFTRHFTTFVTYTQSPIPVVNNPAPSPTPSSGSASAPATPLHETSNGIGNNGNGPIGLFGTVNVPFPLAYGITNSDLAQATTSSQKNVIVITPQSHTVKSSHKTTTKHTSSKSSSAKSNARFTQTLQRGSHGAEVTRLQSLLIGKGFLSGATTGYFGPLTENAVRAYQKANGLSPVGIVGTTTRGLLNNALASSTAPAAKH